MADLLDSSTNVVMGLLVAVILVCSALVPVALGQIKSLETFVQSLHDADLESQAQTYVTMLEVVIVLAIVGLIIGVVRTYTRTNEVD